MESSFSLKPQGLSLITRAPFSTPISARHVGLLRSEHIGCGAAHNLRLSRKRWKKMRTKYQSHYRNFPFRASLDSQRIVTVAASVAAVSVLYVTYAKKLLDVKEMSGRLTLALSDQIRRMVSWILTDASRKDSRIEGSVGIGEDLMKEIRRNHQELRTVNAEIRDGNESTPRGELCIDASHPLSSSAASSVQNLETSTVPLSSGESDAPRFLSENSNPVNSELVSAPVIQQLSSFPSSRVYAPEGLNIDNVASNSNIIVGRFERQDLYKIDELSLEQLDILEQVVSCASLQKNINGSLLSLNGLAEGSKLAASDGSSSAGGASFGRHSQSYVFQLKDSRYRKDFRKKDNNISRQEGRKTLSPSSNSKGKQIIDKRGPTHEESSPITDKHDPNNDKQDPSWQLRVYNQLLREDRLKDCIGLLEDLEESGLLDMNKIYHGRFFDVCKRQRAVKEAFHFSRFIPNPTLSTFNMLMSVCTSSQDSEGAFQVLQHVQDAGLKADCKLYTTLISTCAKSGKVETMFKVWKVMELPAFLLRCPYQLLPKVFEIDPSFKISKGVI